MPRDLQERLMELAEMGGGVPIYFEKVEEERAEYVNVYGDGWKEVFILFNNEDGAHYFWREDEQDA